MHDSRIVALSLSADDDARTANGDEGTWKITMDDEVLVKEKTELFRHLAGKALPA